MLFWIFSRILFQMAGVFLPLSLFHQLSDMNFKKLSLSYDFHLQYRLCWSCWMSRTRRISWLGDGTWRGEISFFPFIFELLSMTYREYIVFQYCWLLSLIQCRWGWKRKLIFVGFVSSHRCIFHSYYNCFHNLV